jgi:hypothetical protein
MSTITLKARNYVLQEPLSFLLKSVAVALALLLLSAECTIAIVQLGSDHGQQVFYLQEQTAF